MRRLFPLLLSCSLLACSPRAETKASVPQQEKKAFFSQIETPKTSADAIKEAYADIPATAGLVFRYQNPNKLLSALQKMMTELVPPAELATFIAEGKARFGVDPLEPNALSTISGLDLNKDFELFIDRSLVFKNFKTEPPSEEKIATESLPLILRASLTDQAIFTAALKKLVASAQPSARLVEAESKGYAITYLYQPQSELEPREVLRAAIAVKDNKVTAVVCPDGIYLQPNDLGDLEAAFKQSAEAYLDKPVGTPISEAELFKNLSARVDPLGDMFLFVDVDRLTPTLDSSTPIRAQDTQKEETNRELRPKMVAAFPGMVMSIGFSEKGMKSLLAAKVVSPAVPGMRSMTPSKDAPPYGTIFPENTSVFARYSLNLLGTKDLFMHFVPKEYFSTIESQLAVANGLVGGYTGLDLERDVLGAFTGHFAYAADYSSMLVQLTSEALPKFTVLAQLTSEDAGDKLLAAIAGLPAKLGAAGNPQMKMEEVPGGKLYSIAEGPVELAWGRCSDIFLLGVGVAPLKEICQRLKTPGTSFAEKSGSELAKNMVSAKSGSGVYMDFAPLLQLLLSGSPGSGDKAAFDIFLKVAAKLGPVVSQTDYDADTQLYFGVGEILFK